METNNQGSTQLGKMKIEKAKYLKMYGATSENDYSGFEYGISAWSGKGKKPGHWTFNESGGGHYSPDIIHTLDPNKNYGADANVDLVSGVDAKNVDLSHDILGLYYYPYYPYTTYIPPQYR